MRSTIPVVLAALILGTIQGCAHVQGTHSEMPDAGPAAAKPPVTLSAGAPTGEGPAEATSDSSAFFPSDVSRAAGSIALKHATVPVINVAKGYDLTTTSASLWKRIRSGFAMPDCASPLVIEQMAYYLNRPDYVKRMMDRSRRYLYHVVEEVEKRGMPTEIALLPMAESAYNPTAYSRARASGIWQFMPGTGRDFGLDQNHWYDERRDVLAATDAALDYLEKLYEMFGSWDLALAAYNAGEGTVSRAISRNAAAGLPADYLNLQLPAETRGYVPKLQAIKNIVATPERFDLDLDDIPNQPYFTAVSTRRQMDAEAAAKLAGIPLAEFLSLNPAYNRPVVIPGDDRPLLLPVDKAEEFEANLQNARGSLVTWQTYTLRRKDRLDRVAARVGMSASRLAEVNRLAPNARLKPGQSLLVQVGARTRDIDNVSGRASASTVTATGGRTSALRSPGVAKTTSPRGVKPGKTNNVVKAERARQPAKKAARSSSPPRKIAPARAKPHSKQTVVAKD